MNRIACILTLATVSLGSESPAVAADPLGVEYLTADGVKIVGDYWAPADMEQKAPVVILLHMYQSDRSSWKPLVPALQENGFAVLAIDLRGHGASTEPADRHQRTRQPGRREIQSHTLR